MKNEIKRCICVDMAVDGQGIARCGELVVFVKGLIKGETADVKIIAEKKNYSVGIIDKLIKSSPYRREPDCAIAYKCGGCDLRHIDYEYQLELKRDLLINTLKGYEVKDITPCEDPFHYRNKVQIPFRDGKMGFYRKYSNDIVEFDDCLLESKLANRIIDDLKKLLKDHEQAHLIRHILIKHARRTDEVMVAFIVRDLNIDLNDVVTYLTENYAQIASVILNLNDKDTNVILGDEEKLLFGRDYILDNYDGIRVKLSLKSFYQVNHEMMEKLYARVKELSGADNTSRILDLYCGIGTISLYMARYAQKVTGVEIVEAAVSNARDNAFLNGIFNADFVLADATKDMDEYLEDKDIVIVDPPRKGLGQSLISSLIRSGIDTVVYVSCNPATLKRDLDLLKDHYEIGEIYPFDMFPFTVHAECAVRLKRIKA